MDFDSILFARKLGGSSTTIEALSVTENGTYTAQEGKAYSPVTVNVSGGSSGRHIDVKFKPTGGNLKVYDKCLSFMFAYGTYLEIVDGTPTMYDSANAFSYVEIQDGGEETVSVPIIIFYVNGAVHFNGLSANYQVVDEGRQLEWTAEDAVNCTYDDGSDSVSLIDITQDGSITLNVALSQI